MKLGTERAYPLIPAGEHLLRLTDCEAVELDDRFGRSNTGKVKRLRWRFVSRQTDDDGVPYDYVTYTGLDYGHKKAGLTKLLDMMVPGITKDISDAFNTNDLLGRRFRARIKHGRKDDGTPRAEVVMLEPVAPRAAAGPSTESAAGPSMPAKSASAKLAPSPQREEDDDTLTDPFADDPD